MILEVSGIRLTVTMDYFEFLESLFAIASLRSELEGGTQRIENETLQTRRVIY